MSATRMPRAERGLDFYETPAWCVRALAPHLPPAHFALDPRRATAPETRPITEAVRGRS